MDKFRWAQSPGKRTCESSEGLDGQIKTLEEWQATVMPGSKFTACKGKCDCRLIPTEEEKTENPFHVISPDGEIASNDPPKINPDGNITANIKNEADEFGATNPDNSNVG